MKSRDTLVRLKRFQVEEKRRRIIQLNAMIAEFTRMANDLDREIATEEQRVNIADTNHYAYPTYARAARTPRRQQDATAPPQSSAPTVTRSRPAAGAGARLPFCLARLP